MQKERVDVLLFEREMVESRSLAQRLVMAGSVRVNGELIVKPSQRVDRECALTIETAPRFVSRGGEKLEPALISFDLDNLSGKICVDVGSSTGGFTDCLLKYGAEKVFAVDVGYGILHWKLRNDPRVEVREHTNARYVESFPLEIDLVTIDASFISLRVLLPVIWNWLKYDGDVIALIKPQFEAGRKDAAKGSGVIRDPKVHHKVLVDTLEYAAREKFKILNLVQSQIIGPKGNIEFLAHLKKSVRQETIPETIVQQIDDLVEIDPEAE